MELACGTCAANNFVCWRGSRLERPAAASTWLRRTNVWRKATSLGTGQVVLYLDSTKTREAVVDTGGQVDSGVVDDSSWIFVRSGTRRADSGRAGWPCGAPGGAAGERDCSFERRLELRGGRVGAFAGRRHGARVVRGLSETGHGGIEEFRP